MASTLPLTAKSLLDSAKASGLAATQSFEVTRLCPCATRHHGASPIVINGEIAAAAPWTLAKDESKRGELHDSQLVRTAWLLRALDPAEPGAAGADLARRTRTVRHGPRLHLGRSRCAADTHQRLPTSGHPPRPQTDRSHGRRQPGKPAANNTCSQFRAAPCGTPATCCRLRPPFTPRLQAASFHR